MIETNSTERCLDETVSIIQTLICWWSHIHAWHAVEYVWVIEATKILFSNKIVTAWIFTVSTSTIFIK